MKKTPLTLVLLLSSLTLLLSACGEKKTNETTATKESTAATDAAYEYKEFTIGQYTFLTTSAREVALVRADQSITSAYLSSTISYQDVTYTLTSIGGLAFADCSLLTSVTIPNSVMSIGASAFYGTALYNNPSNWENGELYINNCLIAVDETIAGDYTIKSHTRLIAASAFSDCSSLISVTIPNSVTSIGSFAFDDCSALTSVAIPNSVTEIGDYAFSGCSSLISLTIPNSVTSIGEKVFNGCSSLTSVTIPNNVTSIGDVAFWGTALYNNPANWENGALYINDCLIKVDEGFADHFRIKENTRVIACGAFAGCSSLTSVAIPNSVTNIGEGAFAACSSLTSVTIPNCVTSIEAEAFSDCSSLISLTIPNSVTWIGDYAFHGCSSLISVTIPNSVTNIGEAAFGGCFSLTSVTIPNNVTSIGDCTFYLCSSLTSVTIPNSVTEIGRDAFYGCSALTSVTIPNSVTSIEDNAFPSSTKIIRQ